MPRINQIVAKSGKKILVIDDQPEYLSTTKSLLELEGHQVTTALNGEDGLRLLRSEHFDLLLLDYYMPGNLTGEDTVKELRKIDPYLQVVLQTGYSGEYPPREMLKQLDIQGYHDKSEGPQKLLMWVDVGLKMAYTVQLLNKSRQGLNYILDVTPDLHKVQTVKDLIQGVLYQVSGLLGAVNSFIAVVPVNAKDKSGIVPSDSFVAMMEEDERLIIRAATGRFLDHAREGEYLDTADVEPDISQIYDSIKSKQIKIVNASTIVPLLVGDTVLGVIYLDMCTENQQDLDLLKIFANQAAVAIQNSRLYEMATLDPLTGVFVRGIFNQWILRELRTAFRSKSEVSLLMMDVDGLKKINDSYGHLAGDQALTACGQVLKKATRSSDFICRYGGDEFAIILPQTQSTGAKIMGNRIMEFLMETKIAGLPQGEKAITVSIGATESGSMPTDIKNMPRPVPQEYFAKMATRMINSADKMLYKAKHEGGNQMYINAHLEWPPLDEYAQMEIESV